MWRKTHTQFTFRVVINAISLPDIEQSQRDTMRDLLWSVLQKEYPSRMKDAGSDICDLANSCWAGLRSLSYTKVETYTCCKNVIQPVSSKERRMTTHDIQLNATSTPKTGRSRNTAQPKPLGDIISEKYFYNRGPEIHARDANGNMRPPFQKCDGQPNCRQLPAQRIRILDDFPLYLCIPISKGCSIKDAKALQWDKDISLDAIVDGCNSQVNASYKLVAVAFYADSHFFARAIDPPAFHRLGSEVVEYDGMRGAAPYAIEGGVLDNLRSPDKTRITLLLFAQQI
jgi:hypothetical protein